MGLVREVLRELQHAPLSAKLLIAGCVVYLLSPIDLIPDFIPVIGQADDVLVLGLLLKTVAKHATGGDGSSSQLLLNKFEKKTGRARGER
jgi:uncharacterized membrane protein YkvA (DUF1232 family)